METEPMGTRSKNATRCLKCRVHIERCVCALVPDVEASTRIVVVMHYREWHKTTATAPLLALALPSVEIRLRGARGAAFDGRGLDDPARRAVVLFPADDAEVLSPALVARDPRPITLIVPDGNWRQASRAVRREPSLRGLPRVVLPEAAKTRYRLREEHHEGGLATYEAVTRALGILEGPQIATKLEVLFEAMVEATLASRGLPPY